MFNGPMLIAQDTLKKILGFNFYKKVVSEALDHRKSASPQALKTFDSILNKHFQVPGGFRSLTKAPKEKLIPSILKHYSCCVGVTRVILELWIESKPELSSTVQQFLSGDSVVVNRLLNDEETTWPSLMSEVNAEETTWSSLMAKVVADFTQQYPQFDQGDASLMLSCYLDENFFESQNKPEEEESASGISDKEDLDDHEDDLDVPSPVGNNAVEKTLAATCGRIIDELRLLPPRAPEWSDVEKFIQELLSIFDDKRQERESVRKELQQIIDSLREEVSEELTFFAASIPTYTSWPLWTSQACAIEDLAVILVQVQELYSALKEYKSLLDKQETKMNLAERRALRDHLTELEDKIERMPDVASALTPSGISSDDPSNLHVFHASEAVKINVEDVSLSTPMAKAPSTEPDRSAENTSGSSVQVHKSGGSRELENVLNAVTKVKIPEALDDVIPLNKTQLVDIRQEGEDEDEETDVRTFSLYKNSPHETSQQIASFILNISQEERPERIRDLIWRLIFEQQFGLAYHYSRYLELEYSNIEAKPPSWLIRAVATAPFILQNNGEMARVLQNDLRCFNETSFIPGNKEWNQVIRLLLVAAALRPALIAPDSGAHSILHQLRLKGLNQLSELCQLIATQGERSQQLDPEALKRVKESVAWSREVEDLKKEADNWYSKVSQMHLSYTPAQKVWLKWQEAGGFVQNLLNAIRDNDEKKLQAVEGLISRISDSRQIEQEIWRTDRDVLGRPLHEPDIGEKALAQLVKRAEDVIAFATSWVTLQHSRQHQGSGFLERQARSLGQEILDRQPRVEEELNAFDNDDSSILIRSGIRSCRRMLDSVWTLFDPEVQLPTHEPNVKYLIHAELLTISNVRLDNHWEPNETEYKNVINELLASTVESRTDWEKAYSNQSEKRDHEATGRILEYLEQNLGLANKYSVLYQRREKDIRDCRAALERDAEEARREVERAFAFGLLKEEENDELLYKAVRVKEAAVSDLCFLDRHQEIDAIRDFLESKLKKEKDTVLHRMRNAKIDQEHAEYGRLVSVLEKGDVLTANEYVEMIKEGHSIPVIEESKDFLSDFFPRVVREYKVVEKDSPKSIIQRVKARENICGIDLSHLSSKEADASANVLANWFTAKAKQYATADDVNVFLSGIGFINPRTMSSSNRTNRWFDVTVTPVRNRKQCPVAVYGSMARGRYRVLCVGNKPNEEELLSVAYDPSHPSPVIIFYFGLITEQKRRDLAQAAHEQRRTLIVIDDALLLYLCCKPESRLRAMFECTLPFTFIEPYLTTINGQVPPEMFYGRDREKATIIDQRGSCFIYGGRQLGKTALLNEVQRTFHNPEEGRIALLLDLRVHGIGYDQQVNDIWKLLADKFKELKVVPGSMPPNASKDVLLKHIQNWISEDDNRRILLLLDEADKFLEIDGEKKRESREGSGEFINVARLKGLMDITDRRFKVIFAGLHNVQRTAKLVNQPNHPLVHYGEAFDSVCIGPLLGLERHEALSLIERPMTAIGYWFESPHIPIRILSQTNYYPSLIQLYCNQLIKHLQDPRTSGIDFKSSSPPCVVSSLHVEDAYRKRLHKGIRAKFNLTLQLDQRYEVITFAIAYKIRSDETNDLVEGFTVQTIREEALKWWEKGFQESLSEDAFRALLDEMVGLGVLRTDGEGQYTLRSINLLSILGTENDIIQALVGDRDVPLQYEPASFRSAHRSDKTDAVNLARRNPLTAQQESELQSRRNGVSVIFGSEASGLNDLTDFLSLAFGEEFFVNFDDRIEEMNFSESLVEHFKKRKQDATTLILVSANCPWNELWIGEALKSVERLTSQRAWARVVFVANPEKSWQLVSRDATGLVSMNSRGLTLFSLGPWNDAALRHWLEDCNLPIKAKDRSKVTSITGNWPQLLQSFFKLVEADTMNWEKYLESIEEEFTDPEKSKALLNSFGLHMQESQEVMRNLALFSEEEDPPSTEDLINLTGISPEIVRASLRWADLLRLISPGTGDSWRINKTVRRILETGGNQ